MKNFKLNKAVVAGVAVLVVLVGLGTWVMAEPLPAEDQAAATKKAPSAEDKKKQELEELKKQMKELEKQVELDTVNVKSVLDANRDQKCLGIITDAQDNCGKARKAVRKAAGDAVEKGKDLLNGGKDLLGGLFGNKQKSVEDGGCQSGYKCTLKTVKSPDGTITTTVVMEPVK